jgi:hypothetical protein
MNSVRKENAYFDNNTQAIQWYSFADSLNRAEVQVLLSAKGLEYWQFLYLVGILKERTYARRS